MRRFFGVVAGLLAAAAAQAGPPDGIDPVTVHVFHDDRIHFDPDDPGRWETPTVTASDNGRRIERVVSLEPPAGPVRVTAPATCSSCRPRGRRSRW